jgi:hypothetical protein
MTFRHGTRVTIYRRIATIAAAAAIGVVGTFTFGTAAHAASVGYVRLAHLSPDTPEVDVYLDSVSGTVPEKVFPGVGYGVVSTYLTLPAGTYTVSMRGKGAAPSTPPVITTQVTVASGEAYTVAGVGKHADLGLRVIDDDLSLPSSDEAKVRIVQASVRAPVLSVSVAGGSTIASDITFATTTDYRQTRAGRWTLKVQPAGTTSATTCYAHLVPGNVYSLIVLDGPNGGLTTQLRVDAARTGGIPQGGVATGAGGTAPDPGPSPAWALTLLVPAGLVVARRWRKHRTAA